MFRTSKYLASLEGETKCKMLYLAKDKTTNLLKSILQSSGNISKVFLILENLTDQQLLAVNIVVVELLIDLLEHGDPLQDVHGIEVIAEVSGP